VIPAVTQVVVDDRRICSGEAGFANPNEITGLVEGLEEEIELGRHPREARLVGWALLGDGVFTARPRTQQRAERLFLDDLSIRLICQELDSRPGNRQLPGDKAAVSLAAALREVVAAEPTAPLNAERLQLAAHLQPDRASFDTLWNPDSALMRKPRGFARRSPSRAGSGLPPARSAN
jgi:hypothetical protein